MDSRNLKFAGFWVRLGADFVDSLILDLAACAFDLMVLGIVYWMSVLFFQQSAEATGSFFSYFNAFVLQIVLFLTRVVFSGFYYTIGHYRYGTTLGKRMFRISVVSEKDFGPLSLRQSLVRCLSYSFSYLPMGAGFLMILFHPSKKALHDILAGTVSLRGQNARRS